MNNKSSSSPSSTSSSSSSSLTTMKVKTLIHNLIFSHICRMIRALSKAKSIFLETFRENQQLMFLKQSKRKNKYRNKILFGSFRLHYNWCSSSSHVLPIPCPSPILIDSQTSHHIYYDSTWNSIYATDEERNKNNNGDHGANKDVDDQEGELSSYLQWLEEKSSDNNEILKEVEGKDENENEIDKLADLFIASCHEKFRLEKIESYRRYQELLARSL